MTVVIAPADLRAIVDAAEAAYPDECCGLLVGRVRRDGRVLVREAHASRNLAEDPRRAFEVDPRVQFALLRRLRGGPDDVIGVYHSHPDLGAEPSATDLARAWEPGLIWLITSVLGGQAVLTTAHRLSADRSRFRRLGLATGEVRAYASRTRPARTGG